MLCVQPSQALPLSKAEQGLRYHSEIRVTPPLPRRSFPPKNVQDNVYPKGASVQFYKLFLDGDVASSVAEYDALAVIEWDVIVAHPESCTMQSSTRPSHSGSRGARLQESNIMTRRAWLACGMFSGVNAICEASGKGREYGILPLMTDSRRTNLLPLAPRIELPLRTGGYACCRVVPKPVAQTEDSTTYVFVSYSKSVDFETYVRTVPPSHQHDCTDPQVCQGMYRDHVAYHAFGGPLRVTPDHHIPGTNNNNIAN